jgi:hypothetical protein
LRAKFIARERFKLYEIWAEAEAEAKRSKQPFERVGRFTYAEIERRAGQLRKLRATEPEKRALK